jgi:N-acetylglucosamine kinase
MTLLIGLDSGGSKTRALLATGEGDVLAAVDDVGLDPNGATDWPARLSAILARLTQGRTITAAVLGLPCHGEDAMTSAAQRDAAAQALGPIPHLVRNDVEIAFDGAFAGGPGVLLLSGTGSMVWAGNGHDSLRVGGWGEVFGDEGSAHWIGREALSLATQALDGRRPEAQALAQAVLAATGTDAARLVTWAFARTDRRAAVAGIARAVCAVAEAGDPVARNLIDQAAAALAAHVVAARDRLATPTLNWAHAGGAFNCKPLLAAVAGRIGPPVPAQLVPAAGAVLRAAQLAGINPDAGFIARIGHGQHMISTEEKY